jgi:cytochrome d ubiquinol oxidase subunit I
MDVVLLSRIQFALTSMFHYIYPPLSIGLGLVLVIMEGMYLKTKKPLYKEMTQFWTKVFALTFALGVATGLVQVFGFGTNWARYSRFVGDVFGSALAAEGVFAFFLEAGFLGIMLFGWNRVRPGIHYLSTILVAAGAHFSGIWIVVANSWMQTPAGYKLVSEQGETRAIVSNFWEMMFNPSAVDRVVHVIIGCWLAGIFLVISVSAYYLLKKKHVAFAKASMKVGLIAGSIALFLQLLSADKTARGVAEHQPSKFAAMEGVYKTEGYAPIYLFGWVDKETQTVKGLKITGFLSFLTYRDFSKPVTGFDQIPEENRPPVQIVFQSYHAMILMWTLMALGAGYAVLQWWRKRLDQSKLLLRFLVFSVAFPQIGNQVGWMTAEVGRQPWIVYGLMRTPEGISKGIQSSQVFGSILMFIVIYIVLFSLFIFLLDRKIKHGPEEVGEEELVYRDQGAGKPL